jgi:hypothetical protein
MTLSAEQHMYFIMHDLLLVGPVSGDSFIWNRYDNILFTYVDFELPKRKVDLDTAEDYNN